MSFLEKVGNFLDKTVAGETFKNGKNLAETISNFGESIFNKDTTKEAYEDALKSGDEEAIAEASGEAKISTWDELADKFTEMIEQQDAIEEEMLKISHLRQDMAKTNNED